jgi:tRNA nucleotidyltransferase/poly(A) polymerase
LWKEGIKILHEKGFEGYLVGGSVRDLLLRRLNKDYDIATNACKGEIVDLFREKGYRTKVKGKSFEVVLVYLPVEIEISTYRNNLGQIGESLLEDLTARDFTINSMAMDIDGNIIDPTQGQRDLRDGIIRANNNGAVFEEDPLRMVRAVRFCTELGFKLDSITKDQIIQKRELLMDVPIERIRREFDRILLSENPVKGLNMLLNLGFFYTYCKDGPILPEVSHMKGSIQNPNYHKYDVWGHTMAVVKGVEPRLILRWAALLHDIAKGTPGVRGTNKEGFPNDIGHEEAGSVKGLNIVRRLKFSQRESKIIVRLIKEHMIKCAPTEKSVMKWLNKVTKGFAKRYQFMEFYNYLIELRRADVMGGRPTEGSYQNFLKIKDINLKLLETLPFFPEDLPVSRYEIMDILGREPGQWLKDYTQGIIYYAQDKGNNRNIIIDKIHGDI